MNKQNYKLNNLKSLEEAMVFSICPHKNENQIDISVMVSFRGELKDKLKKYYSEKYADGFESYDEDEFLEAFTLLFTIDLDNEVINSKEEIAFVQVEEQSTVADEALQDIIEVDESDISQIQECIMGVLIERIDNSAIWDSWMI